MIMSSMMRTHSSILPGFTGYLRTSVKACAQRSVNAHGFEREQKHGAEDESEEQCNNVLVLLVPNR